MKAFYQEDLYKYYTMNQGIKKLTLRMPIGHYPDIPWKTVTTDLDTKLFLLN